MPKLILLAACLACLLLVPLGLPGLWVMVGVGLLYDLVTGTEAIGWIALAGELTLGRSTGHATRVATGALIGRTVAVAVKIAIGFAMAAWLVIAAWR